MDIELWLEERGIWHRFIDKKVTVHTADASQSTGIDLHMITKNLVSVTDSGEIVMLIVPGDKRVSLAKAAKVLKTKNVKLIPFEQSELVSGYPPGGTPSLGYKTKIRVVVDDSLASFETFYCGGGSRDKLLEVRFDDVVRLNEAIIASILA